jgi:predicted Zn-dependent protease
MKIILLAVFLSLSFLACKTNSITGRSQLDLVPEAEVQAMALTQYKEFLSKNPVVPSGNANQEMVRRVGSRLATAVTKYYTEHGAGDELKGYTWEFNLVESKDVNAWCMPGGKVVVYTGLLPITQNETALAIVLGHEITHAVAGHGRERMSQLMLAQGIQVAGNVALSNNPQTVNIFNQVYGPAAQIGVLLPYSRKQETEADVYGLIFAAMAGYNPQEAIAFWTRMASIGGEKPPVFLSDHPADQQRINDLKKAMPEAMKYYNGTKH